MAKKDLSSIKVALVHDFLREYGGAERVVEALHELFPDAPLYTAFTDPKAMGIHWRKFSGWEIKQSWMRWIPLHRRLFSPLRVIAADAFQAFDLSEYDVVISSSNAYFAKAVEVNKPSVHLCYCHTPPRSLYGYSTMTDWRKNPVVNAIGTLINHYTRVIDVQTAQKVDVFIANSEEVKQRIAKFYRRDSIVISPPVEVPSEPPTKEQLRASENGYFVYVNRLAFAKHPELAVQVCTELKVPLKVVGTGKMLESLKQMAGPTVEFLGAVSDEELHQVYAGAKALLYPVEDEDFGMVPVEAMGHGVPVIAHRSGGPKETIVEGKTGVFFDELNAEGLKAAVQQFGKRKFDRAKIWEHSRQFSKESFQMKIVQLVMAKAASKK